MDVASWSPEFARFVWKEPLQGQDFLSASLSGLYPTLNDIISKSPLFAVIIFIIKILLEYFILGPISQRTLKSNLKQNLPFESQELEEIYTKNKPTLPDINKVKQMSISLKKPVEELNHWFKIRQFKDRQQVKLKTCTESLWRLLTYGFCLWYNVNIISKQPWAKDLTLCWEHLPLQPQLNEVKYFYIALVIPLYIVLFLTQIVDKRKAKDQWEMTAHHSIVLVLVILVYLGNFCRIGMIGLALHDVTDLFFESSKIAHNFRYRSLADIFFAAFAFSWAYARLYKFYTTVPYSLFTTGIHVLGPISNVFWSLLLILFILNMYWFYKIVMMMYRLFWAGSQKERQQREFTDLSTDDEIDSDSSYLSDAEPMKQHED